VSARWPPPGLTSNIMIDCSHANSGKDPQRQLVVARDAAAQIQHGNRSIMGLMLESNINAGNQKLTKDPRQLAYGVSVTDPCLDWLTTAALLRELADGLRDTLPQRARLAASADAA
jgi:3-deoxy-7-phosphoheptulonate synthase